MTYRVACAPGPDRRRHLPTFRSPVLPDGFAECLLCGDWITAVELLSETCLGPAVICDEFAAEGDSTLSMITRCAEHQR